MSPGNNSGHSPNPKMAAPIPIRLLKPAHSAAPSHFSSPLAQNHNLPSFTPTTTMNILQRRRPSYGTIESSREAHYNLDYPNDENELRKLQLDPGSRFYARERPRLMDLPQLLPYGTENPRDRAKFLSHIVAHLYIAIKSLDVQGSLSITAKDLASLKNVAGLSDIDLALETNLFEMCDQSKSNDDEEASYFSQEELDVDDDDDDDIEDDSEADDDIDQHEAHDDFDSGESTMQHKKSPKSAAVVSVRIWTHELLVWLKMKYDMSLTLRMALAKVYFAICCCRGQHLNLKIYVKTFELLTKKIDLFKLQGFVLPWEPVYRELANHVPWADASFEPLEKKDLSLLLRLGERSSNFFPGESLPEIYALLGSKFSISNASLVLSSMAMLPLSFQADFGTASETDALDIRHYVPTLFCMWSKLGKSTGVDSHLTSRLGAVAMAFLTHLSKNPDAGKTFGKFGVFSEDHFQYLINTLINSLSINVEKFYSMKTKFFHGFSSAIVFSLNGDTCLGPDGIIDQIDTLLNAIESYVHPSNNGEWSRPISKLVLSLVYQFHKRYNMERQEGGMFESLPQSHKLSDEVVNKFVMTFLPIIRTGLQSKKFSAADNYLTCLGLLAYLNADLVLSYVLLDIYESLRGVISTHRVVIAFRTMEELVRYFASTPVFRVHLTTILTMSLPGIDSNDLTKTMHTLNCFAALANFVPIHDLTEGDGDPGLALQFTSLHVDYLEAKLLQSETEMDTDFLFETDFEIQALKSSTTAFKVLMKSLAERIFLLLENIPDPSKSNGIEKDLCDCLPKFLFIMFESMSEDIFKSFREAVVEFVLDNTIHTIADVVAEICGGLVKRDPKYFKSFAPMLIDKIIEDVTENGAGEARTGVEIVPRDQNLFWNLIILNECIGNAGQYVVQMEAELNELSFFLMDKVKGPTVFASTYLLNQMLQSVTKIRLKEARLINPAYHLREGVDEKCWGGFQFDDYRFSKENLSFDWFIPGELDVQFAVNTFQSHVSRALQNILQVLKSIVSEKDKETTISLELADELRVNFLYLAYGISGISFLFDPSFDEDIPKLNDHKTESLQHRLLLLKQIRDFKQSKSDMDETSIENIHENLQKIVDDIEGKDLIEFNNELGKSVDFDISEYLNATRNDSNESLEDKDARIKRGVDSDSFSKSKSVSPPMGDSARATPRLAGVDMSTMNPAITFRERKLYTSRYYFGDDIEGRRENEMYLQIHRTRHLVGKSLHIICKFMSTHLNDNTKLFKHLLYVLNIWFADVGRERILDHSHAKISFSYVNDLQKINRVRKPFTRVLMGSRIESYHLLRVALHATSRSMTDLDRLLIEDVVRLSCSTYVAIADPAQATLMDAMKRVNGSYNIIIRSSLKNLTKALEEDNHKKIESGLSIFELKRIKSKIQSDFINLEKYIELLHRCLLIDDFEVNEITQRLFKNICGTISPPSKTCLIDESLIDAIRPPDEFIDLEIKAVTLAKEKKRKVYSDRLQKIEDTVVSHEKQNTHWKISSLNLLFLIELQLDFDMPNSNDVFQLLTKISSIEHPVVSRLALKGITKLLNKLYLLSAFGYNLANAYNLEYVMRDFRVVDTTPKSGESYFKSWKKELLNTKDPQFFVDHKANSGWLFWGKSMIAVTSEPCYRFQLSETDESIVQGFSDCVNKSWFSNIVNLWIADNETMSAFQGTDVFLTAGLVMLISYGSVRQFLFQDMLDVIDEVYVRDEKSSHIVVCELISGILISSKHFNPELNDLRDAFLVRFLTNLFENDLTPETKAIWSIFSWWIPLHIDSRRFHAISRVLLDFKVNSESDSALIEATRLSYLRSFIASLAWEFPDPDSVLELCFENICNRYQAIREQVGSLIAISSFAYYGESFATSEAFIEECNKNGAQLYKKSMDTVLFKRLPPLFETIEKWRSEVEDLPAQQILLSNYIYAATTVLFWLQQALNTSIAVQYQDFVDSYIVPFLLNLTAMKDVCQLGNIEPITAFKKVSQIPFGLESLEKVVRMLEKYSEENLNVVQSFILGEFTETVYFKNLFQLTKSQRQRILNLTHSLMYHKNVEIREAEASTFSGLIHTSPPSEIEEIVHSYKSKFSQDLDKIRKKYRKTGFKNMDNSDVITLHGATLGLGALVHAFSFQSPPPKWIPDILTILSKKASGIPGAVGRTAKETLGKFKKTRQDTWHVDSKVFNESQMQDLEGVLWKSYFI